MKLLKVLANKIDLDKAVILGLVSKTWVIIAGPVTALLIATFFTSSLQGYYYTFATLLALQMFVELGLGTVIQMFASHEWAKLSFDDKQQIVGDEDSISRLISTSRIAFKWFSIGSLIAAIGLLIGGYLFFSTSANYHINWLGPWVSLAILTGINISLAPFWSILEGCNQVKTLYGFRILQAVALNLSIWIAIMCGAGLWSASIGSLVSIISAVIFLKTKYYAFFKKLILGKTTGPQINWKGDMLPMQWRIAVSWISGYFTFSLFTPILFKYQGPEIAGQFGMTWNIVIALGTLAGSWLSPKIPLFGMYVAQANYVQLDKLLIKTVKIIFAIIVFNSFMAWGFVYMLPFFKYDLAHRLSSRILPPLPLFLLLVAQILVVTSTPFSAYIRAHKKEPLMLLSVFSGFFVAIFTFFLGKKYSALGVSAGYLLVNMFAIPIVLIIWYRFRKKVLV